MHLRDHEGHCIEELGAPFTEVHEFLDQFACKYHVTLPHRMILHHRLGVELVGVLMGLESRAAARLHVVDDVRRIPTGPEWFLRLPGYMPLQGQEVALRADMLAMLGHSPDLSATWTRMTQNLKCACGYPGPMLKTRNAGQDWEYQCPWCQSPVAISQRNEPKTFPSNPTRFEILAELAGGKRFKRGLPSGLAAVFATS